MVAIFVLTVFLFIISVDLVVLKFQGKTHPAFEPSLPQSDSIIFGENRTTFASNIYLSKGHTWLKNNKNGLVEIGIDAFGSMALGSLSILKCAEAGKELKRGEMIFEGAYGNKTIKFLSPINGIVKSVNTNIIGKQITSPYETWGIQLASSDFSKNRRQFFSGNEALEWTRKEFVKLKSFIDSHLPNVELAGATMYDGGSSTNETASSLVENSINDFEKEFLSL